MCDSIVTVVGFLSNNRISTFFFCSLSANKHKPTWFNIHFKDYSYKLCTRLKTNTFSRFTQKETSWLIMAVFHLIFDWSNKMYIRTILRTIWAKERVEEKNTGRNEAKKLSLSIMTVQWTFANIDSEISRFITLEWRTTHYVCDEKDRKKKKKQRTHRYKIGTNNHM